MSCSALYTGVSVNWSALGSGWAVSEGKARLGVWVPEKGISEASRVTQSSPLPQSHQCSSAGAPGVAPKSMRATRRAVGPARWWLRAGEVVPGRTVCSLRWRSSAGSREPETWQKSSICAQRRCQGLGAALGLGVGLLPSGLLG